MVWDDYLTAIRSEWPNNPHDITPEQQRIVVDLFVGCRETCRNVDEGRLYQAFAHKLRSITTSTSEGEVQQELARLCDWLHEVLDPVSFRFMGTQSD